MRKYGLPLHFGGEFSLSAAGWVSILSPLAAVPKEAFVADQASFSPVGVQAFAKASDGVLRLFVSTESGALTTFVVQALSALGSAAFGTNITYRVGNKGYRSYEINLPDEDGPRRFSRVAGGE